MPTIPVFCATCGWRTNNELPENKVETTKSLLTTTYKAGMIFVCEMCGKDTAVSAKDLLELLNKKGGE